MHIFTNSCISQSYGDPKQNTSSILINCCVHFLNALSLYILPKTLTVASHLCSPKAYFPLWSCFFLCLFFINFCFTSEGIFSFTLTVMSKVIKQKVLHMPTNTEYFCFGLNLKKDFFFVFVIVLAKQNFSRFGSS